MVNPASKVQITTNPALPATCIVCGKPANTETEFVDFNFSIDYYGVVVFCLDCAAEIAVAIEYVPLATLRRTGDELAKLEERCSALEVENGKLNATLDSIIKLRPNLQSVDHQSDGLESATDESAEQGVAKASSGPVKSAAK